MKLIYFAVPFICLSLLIGCGGGGGDSGGDGGGGSAGVIPPKPTVSISKSSLTLNEGEQASVPVSYADLAEVSVSSSDDAAVVALEDGALIVTTSDVDRPVTLTLSVTATLNEREETDTLLLYIKNTSASDLISQVNNTLGDRDNLLHLADDHRLYEFFVDFAYLGGVITRPVRDRYLAQFNSRDTFTFVQLDHQLVALARTLDAYSRGQSSDTSLQAELEQTESNLRDHAAYGHDRFEEIRSFSEVLAPGFTAPDMAFDPESGLYSRFLSNDAFGGYQNGEYLFNEGFTGLSSLVRLSPTDPALCEGV